MNNKPFLTPRELAVRWSTTVGSLANSRYLGHGPAFMKLGRRVLYPLDAINEHERANTVVMAGCAA